MSQEAKAYTILSNIIMVVGLICAVGVLISVIAAIWVDCWVFSIKLSLTLLAVLILCFYMSKIVDELSKETKEV